MSDPKNGKSGFSRRAFIQGTGAAAAAATLTVTTDDKQTHAAEQNSKTLGPQPVSITLQVNGNQLKTEVEPRVTLLDALRDYLDVTGCKRVCDRGTCGACTVLVDDKAIYACSMLAIEAQGKKITTAEGLMKDGELHPIQQAYWNRDASQCGFCTPGFVVACAAVLKENPKATVQEIKHGLDGNICRCGTYEQMAHSLADLAGGEA